MNSEVDERVAQIIREQLRQPALKLTPRTNQKDVKGWDSTAMVSIILAVEEEFDLELSGDELRVVRSVGDLTNLVSRRLEPT